jgi:hypothetical protein
MPSSFFIVEPDEAWLSLPQRPAGGQPQALGNWLGDDLVRAYPLLLVTASAAAALRALPELTGFAVGPSPVTAGAADGRSGARPAPPTFWAVDVTGEPGRDDMGLTPAGDLVVSRRVLDLLLELRVRRAFFAQYRPDRAVLPPTREESVERAG